MHTSGGVASQGPMRIRDELQEISSLPTNGLVLLLLILSWLVLVLRITITIIIIIINVIIIIITKEIEQGELEVEIGFARDWGLAANVSGSRRRKFPRAAFTAYDMPDSRCTNPHD